MKNIIYVLLLVSLNALGQNPFAGVNRFYKTTYLYTTASGSSSDSILVQSGGEVKKIGPITSFIQTLASGVFTPTPTSIANLDAFTITDVQYLRVGSTVTFSGRLALDPTASATTTEFAFTLPVATDFVQAYQLAGVGTDENGSVAYLAFRGDPTNDRAYCSFLSSNTSSFNVYFTITYQIVVP